MKLPHFGECCGALLHFVSQEKAKKSQLKEAAISYRLALHDSRLDHASCFTFIHFLALYIRKSKLLKILSSIPDGG